MTAKAKTTERTNGRPDAEAPSTVQAILSEEEIRAEAEEIRGDAKELTPDLFRKLRPLLRRPIPEAFIQHVPQVTGKPYASTGIRSVQVQMDRLDNVLGPDWWGYTRTFTEGGKLCEVVAWIGSDPECPLVRRDSYGGVDRGSTLGNVFKGSFTNAAKPAFARLGPGWEVYVGAADFDPDTDEAAAEQQGKVSTPAPEADPQRPLPAEKVEPLRKAVEDAGLTEHLPMKLRGFGVDSIEALSVEQALALYEWARGGEA